MILWTLCFFSKILAFTFQESLELERLTFGLDFLTGVTTLATGVFLTDDDDFSFGDMMAKK